jgi:UDP-glucose 4-epimerase
MNNVFGSLNLVDAMRKANVKNMIFSSSATVYGNPSTVPITEDFPTSTTNPYGTSKLMVEQCLTDFQQANTDWSITLLRYFNPTGAHPSGLIGEDPKGMPNNLVPFVSQVAVGRREAVNVFGNDYATSDGTGVRDYIHVEDLAEGHLAALNYGVVRPGTHIFNLGTGKGYSVLDVIAAFERASNTKIPYEIVARRPGDVAECWADATRAAQSLGWHCKYDIDAMMEDVWRWQKQNPHGFG